MEKKNVNETASAASPGVDVGSFIQKAMSFVEQHGSQISTALRVAQGLAVGIKVLRTLRGPVPFIRLGRKSGPGVFGMLALVGAGAAVGAGAGILFAPASGGKTRRKWRRRIEEIAGVELDDDNEDTRDKRIKAAPKAQAGGPRNGVSHAHGSA